MSRRRCRRLTCLVLCIHQGLVYINTPTLMCARLLTCPPLPQTYCWQLTVKSAFVAGLRILLIRLHYCLRKGSTSVSQDLLTHVHAGSLGGKLVASVSH